MVWLMANRQCQNILNFVRFKSKRCLVYRRLQRFEGKVSYVSTSPRTDLDSSSGRMLVKSAQSGMFVTNQKYGIFSTANFKPDATKSKVLDLYESLYQKASQLGDKTAILVGFDPVIWQNWGSQKPLEARPTGNYLLPGTNKLVNQGQDVLFYIKSNDKEDTNSMLKIIQDSDILEKLDVTHSNEYGNHNVLGGKYREGLTNTPSVTALADHILVDDIGNGAKGGSYLLAQKFDVNWAKLQNVTRAATIEEMVGRKMFDFGLETTNNRQCHVVRVNETDFDLQPVNIVNRIPKIFRQALPYGSHGIGKEQGVYFVGLAKSTEVFKQLLTTMIGSTGTCEDALLDNLISTSGSYYYVPSVEELNCKQSENIKLDIDPFWKVDTYSSNPYLFYNHMDYLNRMAGDSQNSYPDPPSDRVLRLMNFTISKWRESWFQDIPVPDIPDLAREKRLTRLGSIQKRKGLAIKKTLSKLVTTDQIPDELNSDFYGVKADVFNIHPDEIIVGRMPRGFSLGLGKKVMDYLTPDEKMSSFLLGLSEASAVGHVIPNHSKLLAVGIDGIREDIAGYLNDVHAKLGNNQQPPAEKKDLTEKETFYQSCLNALEGVSKYIENYGQLALYLSQQTDQFNERQRNNLKLIHIRMSRIANGKPETLDDAAQLLFSFHCCLHLIGQPVAVGRIDQLLEPFLNTLHSDSFSKQDIIDCLWIKFGERVIFDAHFAKDVYRAGSCAVPYTSDGNFPHGDCINQWVQQITVGGYKPTDDATPISACNELTTLCLKAARRLPLNAPCLSLRVHKDMDDSVLKEAAKALLSGGAHPIILHDDRLIPSIQQTPTLLNTPIPLKDARNIGCDGCYEPIVVGKSEFGFTYLPLPSILEQTINHGNNYINAGPGYLTGTPSSYMYSPEADDIQSFDELKMVFKKQFEINVKSTMYRLLQNYGNIGKFCPGPLLSTLVDGCMETGRDIYRGGAKYHFIACMFIGFSNCVDSLYSIKKLCFDRESACVPLKDLRLALLNDWGYTMIPHFADERTSKVQLEEISYYYKKLREQSLAFPKFGTNAGMKDEDLKELTKWLADLTVNTFGSVVKSTDPEDSFNQLMNTLKQEFSTEQEPFDIIFTPGSGTFEGYVGWGLGLGASADGRRKAMPIASDFSSAPAIQDGPPVPSENSMSALQSWDIDAINNGFPNGAEIDLNIHENFPEDQLFQVLKNYAQGQNIGGNVLTFTCADVQTYEEAIKFPEKYDLIRVRTGGWTEFFQTFYNAHKQQHIRRPYYSPDATKLD